MLIQTSFPVHSTKVTVMTRATARLLSVRVKVLTLLCLELKLGFTRVLLQVIYLVLCKLVS